jgi:hypothetical protein
LVKSNWDEKLYIAYRNKSDESGKILMQATSNLAHQSILVTKESFWSKSQSLFVMVNQFCPYGTLSDHIQTRIDENEKKKHRQRFSENLIKLCLFDMATAL